MDLIKHIIKENQEKYNYQVLKNIEASIKTLENTQKTIVGTIGEINERITKLDTDQE